MRLYMNRYYRDECLGFKFFQNRRKAVQAYNEQDRHHMFDGMARMCPDISEKATPIEFDCTKAGVLDLLNRLAVHPDNG